MILEAVQQHASRQPEQTALVSGTLRVSYLELMQRVDETCAWLEANEVRCLGIGLQNSIDWVVLDLAAMRLGLTVVPIPVYFTAAQIHDLVHRACIDCLVQGETDSAGRLPGLHRVSRYRHSSTVAADSKITFTSGSTGSPRGAILTHDVLGRVALSIVEAMELIDVQRHLCVLPLATLLENIAGIYAPLLKGIGVIVPPESESGLSGSSSLDVNQFAACINAWKPHSLILVPQLLMALTTLAEFDMVDTAPLRMVAVGGAKVSASLLEQARARDIPVFEGYGLSEAGSVTTLNLPGASKPGTVGKAMPHAQLRVNDAGEVEVRGTLMEGYLGESPIGSDWLTTGDLGELDEEGYLTILGRKKSLFITAFGRNVNPEWVEAELTQKPAISQALLTGEGEATNLALIWPRFDINVDELQVLVDQINVSLPDYARIHHFTVMTEPLDAEFMTANGRLKRDAVLSEFSALINSHYSSIRAAAIA